MELPYVVICPCGRMLSLHEPPHVCEKLIASNGQFLFACWDKDHRPRSSPVRMAGIPHVNKHYVDSGRQTFMS